MFLMHVKRIAGRALAERSFTTSGGRHWFGPSLSDRGSVCRVGVGGLSHVRSIDPRSRRSGRSRRCVGIDVHQKKCAVEHHGTHIAGAMSPL